MINITFSGVGNSKSPPEITFHVLSRRETSPKSPAELPKRTGEPAGGQ